MVAIIIGPNAPIVLSPGIKSSYFEHAYDFYKPELDKEFPTVDGPLSIACYLRALDHCYSGIREKTKKGIDEWDYIVFHSPYTKLVQKSVARLVCRFFIFYFLFSFFPYPSIFLFSLFYIFLFHFLYLSISVLYLSPKTQLFHDFLRNPSDPQFESVQSFKDLQLSQTYFNKEVETNFLKLSESIYNQKTKPSLIISKQVGNSYTACLWQCLLSLLCNQQVKEGMKVLMFSYGSGLASSMFSVEISDSTSFLREKTDVMRRLDGRLEVSPERFTQVFLSKFSLNFSDFLLTFQIFS